MFRTRIALAIAALLVAIATPATAAIRMADLRGHLMVGYAKLFTSEAPGGSISVGVGVDHPLGTGLRAGLDVGYHLLGSRNLLQGTLTSGIDYSVFETLAQVHWSPGGASAVTLSGGPGLFVARANLGSSPVGASFSSQAVEQTRAGLALGATVARRRPAPVRLGLEAALRVIPLESDTWTLATARIAILY